VATVQRRSLTLSKQSELWHSRRLDGVVVCVPTT
jgi:hypothetical protein